MVETNAITDSKGKVYPLKHSMNCQSTNVIYVIQCNFCNMMYVGETGMTLNRRFSSHRSDIKLSKPTPIGSHFNGVCRPEHAMITPIELIEENKRDLSSTNILDRLEKKEDILERLQREQFWMTKLDTIIPKGLNLKWELPHQSLLLYHFQTTVEK